MLTAAAISGVRPGASAASRSRRGLVRQQPVAQFAHGERLHRREGFRVVGVDDQPRHFVRLVGNDLLGKKMRQWQIGKRKLRRDALFGRISREPRQHVAAAQRRGLGQQFAQVRKAVTPIADRM